VAEDIGTCVNHAGFPATARCTRCHKPLCAQCTLTRPEGPFCSEGCHALFRGFNMPPRGPSRPIHVRSPPPPWHRRHDKAVKRGIGLGCLLMVISPLAAYLGGPLGLLVVGVGWLLFLFSLLAALVLAFWEIPYLLFQRARLHLLDLIVIVALLGNAIGLAIKWVDGEFRPRGAQCVVAYGLPALLCVLWILGGAAWGVWAATMLDREGAWARLRLMLTGLLFPLAIIAVVIFPILALASLFELTENLPAGLVGFTLSVTVLYGVIMFLLRVQSVHQEAKRKDTYQRAAAINKAIDEKAEQEKTAENAGPEDAGDSRPSA